MHNHMRIIVIQSMYNLIVLHIIYAMQYNTTKSFCMIYALCMVIFPGVADV